MRDDQKTKAELLQELDTLRERVSGLKQAVEEWSKTFDATPDLVFVQDKDFRFVKVNKSVCDLLKVKPEDLIGKKCYEVLHKSDKPWPNCPMVKALKDKRPHTQEIYDPNIGISLLITTSPIFDENGELTSVVHIAADITERKKMEDVLRESEEQYRDIFSSAIDAIFIIDLEDHIVDANPEACKMFGYSREEMIGLAAHKLVHPDYRHKQEEFRDEIETKGRIHFEDVNLRKDGTPLNVAVRGTMFAHNDKKHFLVTLRDVTEHKRAEEALRESEESLAIAQRVACIGSWDWNIQDNTLTWSDETYRQFGLKPNEITPTYEAFADFVHRDDRERVNQAVKQALDEQKPYSIDARMIRVDGTEWIMHAQGTIQRNKNGKAVRFVGIQQDITARKKAEKEIGKFKKMADLATHGCAMADLDGNLTYVNDSFARMHGYAPAELIGKNLEIFHADAQMKRVGEINTRLMETGQGIQAEEVWHVRRDSTEFPTLMNNWVMKDNNGNPTMMCGTAIDITKHKKAEEDLLFKSTLLEAQSEASIDGILVVDTEGKSISFNERFGQMWNIPQQILDTRDDEKMLQYVLTQLKNPDQFLEKVRYLYAHKNEKSRDEIQFRDGRVFDRYSSPLLDSNDKYYGRVWYFGDITERRKAEESLVQEKQRLEDVTGSVRCGLLLLDAQTRIIYANRVAEEWFGSFRQVRGKLCYEIFGQDEKECAGLKALKTGGTARSETFTKVVGGGEKFFYVVASPLKDSDGKVNQITEVVLDITERKKAEEALRESERQYKGLAESLNEVIYRADLETFAATYVNNAVERLYGYSVEEWLSDPNLWDDSIHPDDRERVLAEFTKAIGKSEGAIIKYRIIKKDKEVRWVEDCVSWERDQEGKVISMNGIMYDITERKKAEEALRESEERLRVALSAAQMGTWRWDPVTNQDTRDASLNQILGLEAVESTQPVEDFLHFVHPEDRDMVDEEIQRAIRERRTYVAEFRIIRPDGTVRWLRDQGKPLCDENDRILCLTGAVIDITELKQAQEKISKYREKMVQAEELAAVGTLSATLAHELTQPLTVLSLSIGNSLAELEKMSCPGTVVEDLKEGLSEISSMTSMINRFRNFAKMSLKRTASEVDFKAIAGRIVRLLDESAWRAKVTLQVEGMDKLPLIYSYERDLEQLFFSLIENAIQAADGKKKRRVVISGAVRDDEHIELQFSDNCGGIAPENLDRIFEPFFTTKHAGERTGLGLCVVERIVSQLGGKVRVESEFGKSSTFFVTLPIKGDER